MNGVKAPTVCRSNEPKEPNECAESGGQWLEDERYRLIMRQTGTFAFEYDLLARHCFVSPFISEYLSGTYDGRLVFDVFQEDHVVHPDDLPILCNFYRESPFSAAAVTVRLLCRDSAYRWYKLTASLLDDAGEAGSRLLGTISNVDEEKRMRDSLCYRAEFDFATGIYNKETFYQKTKSMLQANQGVAFNLVRLDIDRFKMVNELYGVAEGDKALRHVGQLIKSQMEENETYAHLRDDVFCMCVRRNDKDTISLIRDIEDELNVYPLPFRFVFSAGICRVGHYQGEPISVLCDRAGMAQRLVKGSYARHYAFYRESMSWELRHEQEIFNRLQVAILERQFTIYLQPKVEIATGKIFGAEALVRWMHPMDGLISPSDFIPLSEKNGFILQLDVYVWDLTCRTLRSWLDRGIEPLPISVNVSRVHLYDPDLCETFRRLMQKYRLPPRLLELELTESAYTENPQVLYDVMEKLQAQGFAFLMDDFGSGYSSLNMLKDVPVDVLKIDLSFLKETLHSDAGRIILESAIQMAKRLHLPVIAEGVETAEQAAFLAAAGCTQAQGYFYSRPVPIEEFERIVYGQEGEAQGLS